MRLYLTFIVWFFSIFSVCGQQNLTISGLVQDANGEGIPKASVYLKNKTKIVSFTFTNDSGHFQFPSQSDSSYLQIEVRALGYKTVVLPANIQSLIRLEPSDFQLNEVVVHGKAPSVVVKKDTTEYIVKKYLEHNQESIEDILKKLPGISVLDNGKLLFKGKEISKVLVEGDDLFSNRYTLGTRNIKAHLLERIEAIEHFSENELLRGIEKSDQVALNLTFNNEKKTLLNGSADVASNFQDRFSTQGNGITLNSQIKNFILVDYNTIRYDPDVLDFSQFYPTSFASSVEFIGKSPLISSNTLEVPELKVNQYVSNRILSLNDNIVFRVHDRVKSTFTLNTTSLHRSTSVGSQNIFFLPQNEYVNFFESLSLKGKNSPSSLTSEHVVKISPTFHLKYSIGCFKDAERRSSDILSSSTGINQIQEVINNRFLSFYQNLEATKKITDQRVMLFKLEHVRNQRFQELSLPFLPRSLQSYLLNDSIDTTLKQSALERDSQLNLSLSFRQRINPYFTSNTSLGGSLIGNQIKACTGSHLLEDNENSPAIGFSELKSSKMFLHNEFVYSRGPNTVIGSFNSLILNRKWAESSTKNLFQVFFLPSVSYSRKLSAYSTILVSYKPRVINQLDRAYDFLLVENFRTLKQGVDSLYSIRSNLFILNWNTVNLFSHFKISVLGFYQHQASSIAQNSQVQSSLLVLQPSLVQTPSNLVNLTLGVEKYVPFLALNVKNRGSIGKNQNFAEVNQFQTEMVSNSYQYQLEVSSVFKKSINFDVSYRVGINRFLLDDGILAVGSVNSFSGYKAKIRLHFSKSLRWQLIGENRRQEFQGTPNSNWFFDSNFAFSPQKKRYSFQIQALNILNARFYTIQGFGDTYFVSNQVRLNPRWVVFGFSHQF